MKRFVLAFLLFVLFAIALSSIGSLYLDRAFPKDLRKSKQLWVLQQENESYDFAAIGSSRIYNMLDIRAMENVLGKKGINLGTSGSCYAENYLLLEKFIRTNTTKTVLMGIDEFCFSSATSYSYPFHEFDFAPFLKDDTVSAVVKERVGAKYYLWKLIPISKYIEFNDQFTFLRPLLESNEFYNYLDSSRGFKPFLDDNEKVNRMDSLKWKSGMQVNAFDYKYFLKIVSLCKNANIKLILITPPESPTRPSIKINGVSPFQYCKKMADSLELPYYDFNQVGDFSKVEYFRDYTHTNLAGTSYYSSCLAALLRRNGELESNR